MIELSENRYGKSCVRLMKVTRTPDSNDLREWSVQMLLTGDSTAHTTPVTTAKFYPPTR